MNNLIEQQKDFRNFLPEPIPLTEQIWDDNIIPLVSISCTTYNHEKFIRDAIEGFLMQKTTFRVEILIHDDASNDNTPSIIKEYELKYPHLFKPIYQTENQYSKQNGSVSRIQHNRAIGKYYALCEGDDYWIDPLKLQKQVDFLEQHQDYSMCFHNAIKLFDNKKHPQIFNNLAESREITLENIVSNWIIPTASIMLRRAIFPLPDWSKNIYSNDMTIALIAISKGKIYYLNSIMSIYRINFSHEDSMTFKTAGKHEFVLKEHIKLYNFYLNDPLCANKDAIVSKINMLTNELRFQQLKKHSYFLSAAKMPKYFLKKVINRLSSKNENRKKHI
jgi:glycosyltransferase involved in cell wall biosynthesis